MRSTIWKALGFLLFLGVLAVLLSAQSKALNLFSACLVLAFCAVGSGIVVIRTFFVKAGQSHSSAGWGNPFSVLPGSLRRWLLDEKGQKRDRAGRLP